MKIQSCQCTLMNSGRLVRARQLDISTTDAPVRSTGGRPARREARARHVPSGKRPFDGIQNAVDIEEHNRSPPLSAEHLPPISAQDDYLRSFPPESKPRHRASAPRERSP